MQQRVGGVSTALEGQLQPYGTCRVQQQQYGSLSTDNYHPDSIPCLH